ncbi:S8 family serine peptidase [Nonomuraea sp. NPDC049625]|uniref:S8 family serine peptidase n=1 Tax=Nonomuraea sp. NPDC049625 TaxID=3155775 RepID=UPI003427D2D9
MTLLTGDRVVVSASGHRVEPAQGRRVRFTILERDGHMAHSGTSMAAPHVAGAAAIIAQQHPDWNGERIKAALVESAKAGTGWTALVTNPRAGHVSLRATAGDHAGAGVVQTITRAWAVGS